MQQRYYDPLIGRFVSVDPVRPDAQSGGNFNRYWYANNSPYRYTDPDGRDPFQSWRPRLTVSVGVSATLFHGTGIGTVGSNGKESQGVSVGLTITANPQDGQLAITIGGNELQGHGSFVGGGVVAGAGVNNGPLTSGRSPYDASEASVGIGPVSGGRQLTENKDSAGGTVGTRLGAGAGAYIATGPGSQLTIATPTYSEMKSFIMKIFSEDD